MIQALSSKNAQQGGRSSSVHYVPYRNSTLTWLLKDSIGGNSKSVMLATISPTDAAYVESISTLRYVERAKLISTHAVINETSNDSQLIAQLQRQVASLQRQLVEKDNLLQSAQVSAPIGYNDTSSDKNMMIKLHELLEQKQKVTFPVCLDLSCCVFILLQIIDEYEKGLSVSPQVSNIMASPSNPTPSNMDPMDRMKMLVLSYKKEKELMQGQYDSLMARYKYVFLYHTKELQH